jgi:benzylsuccinate CoA-transferase BbsF subunit
MASLPLQGIRVTDFSWIINGPQIGLWLATMGAEVIKVESRVYLDFCRLNPAMMADGKSSVNNNGAYHTLNYGKKSINLNVKTPRGKQLANELIKRSDFVLECYPSPLARRLGLSYEELRAVKGDIIVISVSLLGKTGCEPADWVGWGPMACSFVGTFDAQGYPGGPPRHTGGTWPDYAIGTAVVFHALAALRHRNRTGEGQWIDASMGETVIGETPEWYMDYFINGRDRRQWANRDDVMAPHNTYPSKGEDKWIAIAVANDDEWRALCGVMGNPAWTREPKFVDQKSRLQNRDEIDAYLREWTVNYEHIELAERLQSSGVPAGPVLDSVEIHRDRHLWEWGYWWEIEHRESGRRVLPGIPAKLSNVPNFNFCPPPDLGEHNFEVFNGILGLSREEIESLMEQKVIY